MRFVLNIGKHDYNEDIREEDNIVNTQDISTNVTGDETWYALVVTTVMVHNDNTWHLVENPIETSTHLTQFTQHQVSIGDSFKP